ncbi:LysR family transcriptional regulator [Variovorax sp. LjRoot84]|uniref:LysR family transcriptional regulator n=1 Tax=Variovorax sp. LjRoot84 TaxID=3342340 RepID=UPI003ECF7F9D
MRFNKLDLNLLVALDALLTERSISRAGERLHLSQSATSNALARLRAYFNDDLLVQVGRKMELTPRAETLKDAVRDVLVRVDSAILAQPRFDPAQAERRFRLIVSDYSSIVLMPQLLTLVSQQSRTVRFDLLPLLQPPHRELESGEADLLILPLEYRTPEPHPFDILFEEQFVCAVWSGGRFGHADKLTADQYATAGHVVMQPSGMDEPTLAGWLKRRYPGVRRIEVTSYSFAAVPYLIVGTDRIAMLHARLARLAQKSLPLRLLPAPVPMPAMKQTMQWHTYRTQDPGLVWLRGLLHQAVARMDAELEPAYADGVAETVRME